MPNLEGLPVTQGQGLNRISFMKRDLASQLQEKLRVANKSYFDTIEQALFVLVLLDEPYKQGEEEKEALFLQGKYGYVSKSMHFIYNKASGRLWANFEHTFQDALTLVNILKGLKPFLAETSNVPLTPCWPIKEVLDEADLQILNQSEEEYKRFTDKIAIKPLQVAMDEKVLTQNGDALTQAVHTYALLKVLGRTRGIYEAVAVPHFAYGRTECLRSPSTEMEQFARALLNNKATLEQWQAVVTEHKNRVKACKAGLGVERHLLGLKLLKDKVELTDKSLVEEIFASKAYTTLSENFFSSFSLGLVDLTGVLIYMPVMYLGYGVAYGSTSNSLCWNFSYYKESEGEAKVFMLALEEGAREVASFLKINS